MSLIKRQRSDTTLQQKAFSALLPKGRAYLLAAENIRNLRDTICQTFQTAHEWIEDIDSDREPDTMREDALIQWERQLGISSNCSSSIVQRRLCVGANRIPVGAQGPGYIQARLQAVGVDLYVRENIPAVDLITAGAAQFGNVQFSEVQFGQGIDGYLLGNGFFDSGTGVRYDPIVPPPAVSAPPNPVMSSFGSVMSSTGSVMSDKGSVQMGQNWSSWGFVFIVEGPNQTIAQIPSGDRARVERMILRLKPAHLAVYMRVQYT